MEDLAPNGKPYESVWDFPRPPRVERVDWNVRVVHGGVMIADAPYVHRVLETSQLPAYYIDPSFVRLEHLEPVTRSSWCEWKGRAVYADVAVPGRRASTGAWSYPDPEPGFTVISGAWAFYAQVVDQCFVDGELVDENPGSFYGGSATANVRGPYKGAPGTQHW
jgi:uncharacterized protein (DUF427 family)